MPTRCNRGFYCKSCCLLNMFRAPLCPSSGAQEYYTVVAAYVFRVVVFKLLVWCGAEGYVSGLQDAAQHVSGTTMPIISIIQWLLPVVFRAVVMCPVCRMLQHPANRTHNPQLHNRPTT